MIDPLTLNPTTQEDTQAGDRISIDEERAQALYERQRAEGVVVGTVSGYLQSVIAAAEAGAKNARDPETARAHRETLETYRYMSKVHGFGGTQKSENPIRGTRFASKKVTADEVLAKLPEKTRKILEKRKGGLDKFVDDAVEETWGKEGRLLSQEELEARALSIAMDRSESDLDPAGSRVTVDSYIQNFVDKK